MRALALKAGLNAATVCNMEKCSREVSPRTAKAVCDALELPFDQLFDISQGGEVNE